MFVVTSNHKSQNPASLDKTYNEIANAFDSGKQVVVKEIEEHEDDTTASSITFVYQLFGFGVDSDKFGTTYTVAITDTTDNTNIKNIIFSSSDPNGVLTENTL